MHMRDRLAVVVGRVRESAEDIASGSRQTAGGHADLSARTERQAGSLRPTAASMGQLRAGEVLSQAQRLAAAAREFKGVVGACVETVEAGAALVDRAGESLQQIVTHRCRRFPS